MWTWAEPKHNRDDGPIASKSWVDSISSVLNFAGRVDVIVVVQDRVRSRPFGG